MLLLDEPLSALDKKLREQTQFELMNIQSQVGITFVFVTHDQDEAMALSTRIAVMNRGQVVQVGTPSEIYEFPQNRFVADFIGTTNLFEGTVSGSEPGHLIVRSAEAGCDLIVDELGRFGSGQRVWVALRPEKIRLSKEPIAGSRVNQVKGMVWELGYLGNRSTYRIKTRNRQARHRFRAERPAHLGVVHRLERRGVLELDRQLRGGSAAVDGTASMGDRCMRINNRLAMRRAGDRPLALARRRRSPARRKMSC